MSIEEAGADNTYKNDVKKKLSKSKVSKKKGQKKKVNKAKVSKRKEEKKTVRKARPIKYSKVEIQAMCETLCAHGFICLGMDTKEIFLPEYYEKKIYGIELDNNTIVAKMLVSKKK